MVSQITCNSIVCSAAFSCWLYKCIKAPHCWPLICDYNPRWPVDSPKNGQYYGKLFHVMTSQFSSYFVQKGFWGGHHICPAKYLIAHKPSIYFLLIFLFCFILFCWFMKHMHSYSSGLCVSEVIRIKFIGFDHNNTHQSATDLHNSMDTSHNQLTTLGYSAGLPRSYITSILVRV